MPTWLCVNMAYVTRSGYSVKLGLKDDQENRYNGDGDFIKPLPCHRLQNMHKYP